MTATTGVSASSIEFLKLLAHELRWQLLAALAMGDWRVQELVARVGRPMNLVSYHLAQLRSMDLVRERRSSADARDVYYSLDLDHLRDLYAASGAALHPLLGELAGVPVTPSAAPHLPVRVLFLCTHNSARSQMAEALLRQLGGAAVEVFSAGTEVSTVHPLAIAAMAGLGLDMGGQRSKHLDEFRGQAFDYIITVCDRVREECPVFPGDPEQIHWSFADPAAVTGDDAVQWQAFAETARQIAMRVRHVLPVLGRAAAR